VNNQTGAQFEILLDGKPRSYRDTKSGAMEAATFPQGPTAAQRGCGKRSADRNGRSRRNYHGYHWPPPPPIGWGAP
jgi:hypothetical protein